MYSDKKIKWTVLFGAGLWLVGGIILSLRTAGTPPFSFRETADLMPVLALGLVLIGVSSGLKMRALVNESGRLFKLVCLAVVISSVTYACGVMTRQLFLQGTGWEPLMPVGFLGFIISWGAFGVLAIKRGILSRLPGFLIIASAVALLTFNDQFNPYGAVVFGVMAFLGVYLSDSRQSISTQVKAKGAIKQ